MDYLSLFNMPKPMKITGRSSTITNSFINAIIPVIQPTEQQVKDSLEILEMDLATFQCSYCGAMATEWDHLRPLVVNKKPTGYVSEINNLVPACGKCNQSKGNKEWIIWMLSDAGLSPKTKGVQDIELRMDRLQKYEELLKPTKVDFETLVGAERWEQHWANWESVQATMRNAQVLADEINSIVAQSYK